MIVQLKAELRKLLTVRSTYLITGLSVLIIILIFGYGTGYRSGDGATSAAFTDSLLNLASFVSLFAMIVGILMMGHEYRYNTITYTLASSNSRSKVLLSKIIVLILYCLFLTVILSALGLLSMALGAKLGGNPLPPQDVNYVIYLVKGVFFVSGTALAGMLFATYIRNMVAAFAVFLILPNLIETLANLLIKENSVYMPFAALNEVIITVPPDLRGTPFVLGDLSPMGGALVFLAYLVPAWLIAWYLFLRRDAT